MGEPRKPSEWIDDNVGMTAHKKDGTYFTPPPEHFVAVTLAYLNELQRLNPELKWPK